MEIGSFQCAEGVAFVGGGCLQLQTTKNVHGTTKAYTTCKQFVDKLATTCLQVCYNLCIFTRVVEDFKFWKSDEFLKHHK